MTHELPLQQHVVTRPGSASAAAVARMAGVSAATVSYVMNGKAGVSTETREHVLTVASGLGFTPRNPDSIKDPRRTRVIGLVFPNIINPMYPRWAQGVTTAAAAAGYEVFLTNTRDDSTVLSQVMTSLASRNVDGVILAAALEQDATSLRILRAAKIPFVYLSRRSPFVAGDFVGIDDDAAGEEIMEHVLSHGYTRIATVIGPRHSTSSLARERGFVRTAARGGVSITGTRKISTTLDSRGGRLAAEALLTSDSPPQVIVCGSDEIAIGVLEYAADHGIHVPEKLAVTGYDGLPHSLSGLINLTTIIQPQLEMATEAFAMLQKRMATPSSTYQSLLCAHQLHTGKTCGCPVAHGDAPPRS